MFLEHHVEDALSCVDLLLHFGTVVGLEEQANERPYGSFDSGRRSAKSNLVEQRLDELHRLYCWLYFFWIERLDDADKYLKGCFFDQRIRVTYEADHACILDLL